VHFPKMTIFPIEDVRGRSAPSVNLGSSYISETITARMFKFYTHLDRA